MDSNSSHWYICEERSGEGAQFISYLSPSTHTHTHTLGQGYHFRGKISTMGDKPALMQLCSAPWLTLGSSPFGGGLGTTAAPRKHRVLHSTIAIRGRWSRNEWEEPWTCPTGCAFSGHLCPSLGPSSPTHVTESQLGGHLCPMKFLIPVPKSGAQ